MSVEAGTGLGSRTRQITMTDNLSIGEHLMKDGQQVCQPFGLSRGTGVALQSVLIQPTLVADADGTMVVRHSVSTDLQQHPMLRLGAVTADIEMIPYLAELACAMVTEQLLHRVVLVAPCSRAVQH